MTDDELWCEISDALSSLERTSAENDRMLKEMREAREAREKRPGAFQFLTASREPKFFWFDLPNVGKVCLRLRLVGLSVAAADFVSPTREQVDVPPGITAVYNAAFTEGPVALRPKQRAYKFSYEGRVDIMHEGVVLLALKPVAQVSVAVNYELQSKDIL